MKGWQSKVIKENIKNILSSGILYLFTLVTVSIWDMYHGKGFEWVWLEIIDQPSLFVRLFYSAITFVTLGALLYAVNFYKLLWHIIGDWKEYKKAKSAIWGLLMVFMYFYGVPKIIDFLNFIISIFYNIFNFILYISPFFAISLLLLLVIQFIKIKYLKTEKSIS
jgi:hypothetical protein